jgi:hypothetical protein
MFVSIKLIIFVKGRYCGRFYHLNPHPPEFCSSGEGQGGGDPATLAMLQDTRRVLEQARSRKVVV